MNTPASAPPPASRWAAALLVLLGVEKALAAVYGLGILLTGTVGPMVAAGIKSAVAAHPTLLGAAALVWYGANAALALVIARALLRGRRWAPVAAVVFGAFHAFGIVGFMLFGPVVLLNGALGVAIAVLALRAAAGGAYRRNAAS